MQFHVSVWQSCLSDVTEGFEIGIEIPPIWSNTSLASMMSPGWSSPPGTVTTFPRAAFTTNPLDTVLFDVGVGSDRVGFSSVCDWRICDGSVDVTDMGFSETIKTLVDSAGDNTEGSSACGWRISSGSVTWGTMAVTDRSLALLLRLNACCESVIVEDGESEAARLVSMFDITVTWTSPRGSGLTTTSLVPRPTWCMCTTGLSGRCVPSSVWAIAAGPESQNTQKESFQLWFFDLLPMSACLPACLPVCSLLYALGQWGRSKKRAGDERGLGEKRRVPAHSLSVSLSVCRSVGLSVWHNSIYSSNSFGNPFTSTTFHSIILDSLTNHASSWTSLIVARFQHNKYLFDWKRFIFTFPLLSLLLFRHCSSKFHYSLLIFSLLYTGRFSPPYKFHERLKNN